MGNKTKLTQELIKTIGEYLRQGHFVKFIAERLGIGRTTLYRWIAQGEESTDGIFRELWNTVQTCRAEGIMKLHDTVMSAAENDPRLALEMLSRMQPAAYGKKSPFHDLERAAAEEVLNNVS
jgi:transposase-like protein